LKDKIENKKKNLLKDEIQKKIQLKNYPKKWTESTQVNFSKLISLVKNNQLKKDPKK